MTFTADPTYAMGRTQQEHARLAQQAALMRPVTARLLHAAGVRAGMRVLDVGSGVGDVAFLLREFVGADGEVVGVDLDGAALETARRRAALEGYTNVHFLQGDVRTIDPGRDFDAAVGRLVLMYLADPAAALQRIATHVRAGGLLIFQELDLDPAPTRFTYPRGEWLWEQVGTAIKQTFLAAGVHMRMGRDLLRTFADAGLPTPAMLEEAQVGGGPDYPGYAWLANTMRNLAPLAERHGIATATSFGFDTLADRLRDEAVTHRLLVRGAPILGAFCQRA